MEHNNLFYVYQWVNTDTNEVFYIGKGIKGRAWTKHNRNSLFKDYIKNNPHYKVEILKYFELEQDAFLEEEKRISELNPCCNIAKGGYGGFQIAWTKELREWKSKYNPMKDDERRKNMSLNNPMKNKEISEKVAIKKRKIPIINNIEYESVNDVVEQLGVCKATVWLWCKRGYDTFGNPCRYKGEIQKEYVFKKAGEKSVIIDGIYFPSVKDGAKYIGVWSETLIRAIKENRLCKGHICEYANQQPSQANIDKQCSLKGSETNG